MHLRKDEKRESAGDLISSKDPPKGKMLELGLVR